MGPLAEASCSRASVSVARYASGLCTYTHEVVYCAGNEPSQPRDGDAGPSLTGPYEANLLIAKFIARPL